MKLIVSRDSGYADVLRQYAIILDGKIAGEIGNGETMEFPIGPGKHRIAAKIDWCTTPALEFTASADESSSLQVRSNLRGPQLLLTLWYVLVERSKYLHIEQTFKSPLPAER